MEKLQKYLAVLKKYQVWAICAIVAITALACYLTASSGLAKQTASRSTALTGKFNAVKIEPGHPNLATTEAIQKKHDTLKRGVFEAWEILYREQKKNNPLPAVLDKDFKTHFENLKPKEELPPVYREQYQNFIKNELPTLLTLVDARRPPAVRKPADAAGAHPVARPLPGQRLGAMAGGEEQSKDDWIGIVDWNPSDITALEAGFDWQSRPSTLEVVLAQENLWVIQALLKVIHRTNDGATNNATAAVKRIESLQIGQAATAAWRHGIAATAEGGDAAAAKQAGGTPVGEQDAAALEAATRQKIIEGRYFDEKEQPVPFADDAPNCAQHPYAEFAMMPVRMQLLMDERKVPKLLVECANSSMPIEIRQVHLRKTGGGELNLDGLGKGPSAGPTGRSHAAPAGGSRPGGPAGENAETSPHDVPVEILGVIYIYNPPVAAGDTVADGATTEGAAPAVEPGANP